MKKLIIAVDGYSSCGKSTFAKEIAAMLSYKYIDTGAMYRSITLFALQNNLIIHTKINSEALINALPKIQIDFKYNSETKRQETYLNSVNVENEIRGVEVSENVSQISKIAEVRTELVKRQKEFGKEKGIVMDGRDIGTVVFPQAELKIFMIASPEIRAQRRYDELTTKGEQVNFETIKQNIIERDYLDETRDISPLRKAKDAILLDNSNMSVKEQMLWVKEKIAYLQQEDED